MCLRRAHSLGFGAVALALLASAQPAAAQNDIRSTIRIEPGRPGSTVTLTEKLQLEAFINDRPTNLIAAFVRRSDGTLESLVSELDQLGLKVPEKLRGETLPVPLALLPGVTYRYDEPRQSIFFTATSDAEKPNIIDARGAIAQRPPPVRPPLGAVLNYTLFGSADSNGGGPRFTSLSGAFETRVFGSFGLLENNFIARIANGGRSETIRLDTSYIRENPTRMTTMQIGDTISGGFSWTRPIRMAGIQYRRSFDLRPDLVTIPVPTLSGTAAASSTLDLYVNGVRAVSAQIPAGPYQIDHPPMIYGGGAAQVVVRDALGRETISSTPFYASPQLLSPGLSDFSAELGFARRNFAVQSNDYGDRLAGSVSYRRGMNDALTVQGHAEFSGNFASAGGGALFTVGAWGIASAAISASRTGGSGGALIDLSFESHRRGFSLITRFQRTTGDYQDLASVSAARSSRFGGLPPIIDRRVYGPPRSLRQIAISAPLPWAGGQIGATYVHTRVIDRTRIANLSFTQSIARFSIYASAVKDFSVRRSNSFFLGLSMPLGNGITTSAGASRSRGATSGYVEAMRQISQDPGSLGWSIRAADGDRREIEGAARYTAGFARFEAHALAYGGKFATTGLMEGGVALLGGDMHFAQRLDQSFALVKVGAQGVAISRENRPAGVTGRHGTLLVTELAAFSPNQIALDPSGLPLDANVSVTAAVAIPYARQPMLVDMTVRTDTGAALLTLATPDGQALPLATRVMLDGAAAPFIVGYDGQAYLEGLKALNRIVATTPTGTRCAAAFPFRALPGRQVRIALTCRPQ